MKNVRLLTLVLSMQLLATSAYADFGLLAGAHRVSISSLPGSPGFAPFGGLAYYSPQWEVDLLYAQKVYISPVTETSLQLPIFYRLFLGPTVTLGLGAYFDYMLDTSQNALDYGLASSLQGNLQNNFFFGGRFLKGVKSYSGSTSITLAAFVGYKFK